MDQMAVRGSVGRTGKTGHLYERQIVEEGG